MAHAWASRSLAAVDKQKSLGMLGNGRLAPCMVARLVWRGVAPSASSDGGEMVGRFSHGKYGSYQRLVDEGDILPCTLLNGLAEPILMLKAS